MTSSRQDHVAFKYYIHLHQGLCSSYLGSISLRDSNQVNMKANNSGNWTGKRHLLSSYYFEVS